MSRTFDKALGRWLNPATAVLLPSHEELPDGWYETDDKVGQARKIVNWSPEQLMEYGAVEGAAIGPAVETAYLDYVDSAVVTPGNSIGLVLDERFGLERGPEQVTGGDFSTPLDWPTQNRMVISGGVADFAANVDGPSFFGQTQVLRAGAFYEVLFDASETGVLQARLNQIIVPNLSVVAGPNRFVVQAGADDDQIILRAHFTNNYTGTIDNLSVREIKGNHSPQPTPPSARSSGRRRVRCGICLIALESFLRVGLTISITQPESWSRRRMAA